MRGASVTVRYPVEESVDSHGNAVESFEDEIVDNVLIMPGVTADDIQLTRPYGVEVAATLAFPKGYDRRLRGCTIYVPQWNRWFSVVGDPYPVPHNCPTAWNYKVWLEATDG